MSQSLDTIVIGAGVAGLTVARELQQAGQEVLVLEKSRGFGGRAATRTRHGNRIDHGAQYFTVRDARFQKQVDAWLTAGSAQVWTKALHTLNAAGLRAGQPSYPRYIFPNGMNGIGKTLAEDVIVKRETRVSQIIQHDGHYEVVTESAETFLTARVIVNTPAEQALALCEGLELGEAKEKLEHVTLNPCIAVLAGYDLTHKPDWHGIRAQDNALNGISWLAHDSSKRTDPAHTVIVIHASPDFSQANYSRYDTDRDGLIREILTTASELEPWLVEPIWTDSQRWRYAQAQTSHDAPFIQVDNLFFCGDWCGGSKLEDAYVSGLELAHALTQS
ncbi:MAG: FAD-dependent oxidoreductase [Deinococcota bacterium]